MAYKCGVCKKRVEFNAQNIGIRCPYCGSKLFYKERPTVANVEKVQKAAHPCARCGSISVYRIHTGIWDCQKCGHQFAGGAYAPSTGAGQGADKALRAVQDKLS